MLTFCSAVPPVFVTMKRYCASLGDGMTGTSRSPTLSAGSQFTPPSTLISFRISIEGGAAIGPTTNFGKPEKFVVKPLNVDCSTNSVRPMSLFAKYGASEPPVTVKRASKLSVVAPLFRKPNCVTSPVSSTPLKAIGQPLIAGIVPVICKSLPATPPTRLPKSSTTMLIVTVPPARTGAGDEAEVNRAEPDGAVTVNASVVAS